MFETIGKLIAEKKWWMAGIAVVLIVLSMMFPEIFSQIKALIP